MSKKSKQLFFRENGHIIGRNIVSLEDCKKLISAFNREIKPYGGRILRSTTAKKEIHHFTESGLIVNPLLNIHELDKQEFPEFFANALSILSASRFQELVQEIMGEQAVMVQSVYYESSAGTLPHQDSHYFDSEDKKMFGCWIALEDIHEDAGRFCVYPKSASLGDGTAFSNRIAMHYKEYEKLSLDVIRSYKNKNKEPQLSDFKERQKLLRSMLNESGIERIEPELNAGDVVFFSSKTLHSSKIPANGTDKSRSSLIGHFVPASKPLIRYRQDMEELNPCFLNGLIVHQSNHLND